MAINHIGYLDFTFAGYAALPAGRLVRFMAKQEVFSHPISGPLMRGMHHIPVDRAAGRASSYRAALQALQAGEIVGVFRKRPSAGLSSSRSSKPARIGMATAARVPLRQPSSGDRNGSGPGPAAPAGPAASPSRSTSGAGGGAARHRADVAGTACIADGDAAAPRRSGDAPRDSDRWWLPAARWLADARARGRVGRGNQQRRAWRADGDPAASPRSIVTWANLTWAKSKAQSRMFEHERSQAHSRLRRSAVVSLNDGG